MTDDEITTVLDQLSRQQALQTRALRAALEGRWADGEDSVAAYILALDPQSQLEPRVPQYQ